MAQTRKKLRDGMVAALADESTGFNARLASIAAVYGLDQPYSIDWGSGSPNVFFGFLDRAGVDISSIREYPAAVVYTSESTNAHRTKGRSFSGEITGHVDIYIHFREGAEQDADMESACEAVEEAVLSCFEDATWPDGITGPSGSQCTLPPIEPLGDGCQRVVPMAFRFTVSS